MKFRVERDLGPFAGEIGIDVATCGGYHKTMTRCRGFAGLPV